MENNTVQLLASLFNADRRWSACNLAEIPVPRFSVNYTLCNKRNNISYLGTPAHNDHCFKSHKNLPLLDI